jgi:hypothetical protein
MHFIRLISCIGAFLGLAMSGATAVAQVSLVPQAAARCTSSECSRFDAIVFVHGIYGDDETYRNDRFDWPTELAADLPRTDVYRLNYRSNLITWSKSANPRLEELADGFMAALKPLRTRQYRSIGFIAHSLGGNLVATYIHLVSSRYSHPHRSQNAYVITLATPVLGSQVADMGTRLKTLLGMPVDDSLTSLAADNQFARMMVTFRVADAAKSEDLDCRRVHLHAGYEQEYLGPLLIVTEASAAKSIAQLADSPIVGFPRDHSQIAKPSSKRDPVYVWVADRLEAENARLDEWDRTHPDVLSPRRMCGRMDAIPERP